MNHRATVLAVDNGPEELTLLVKILTSAGYQVKPADSGELALAAAAASPPDLILLETRLNDMDGLEVCRQLMAGEATRHIPIILVGTFTAEGEWLEGLQLGAADYVTKPFEIEEVLTRVETQLSLSRARASLEHQAAELRQSNDQLRSEVGERERVERELRRSLDQAGRSRRAMLSALEDEKHAESERAVRTQQQAGIADLGQLALAGVGLSALMDRAVRTVAEVLGVELCDVLEVLPGRSAVLLRAGVGRQEGFVGCAAVSIDLAPEAGFALQSGEPVVVEDMRTEKRFPGRQLLHDQRIISGLSTIIGEPDRPYGVLGVHTTRRRTFSVHDVHFLQGVAHLLAGAVQREAHQAEIEQMNRLYATLSQVSEAIVRCKSREELFPQLCRVVVDCGRFEAAWVGLRAGEGEQVTTEASHAARPEAPLALPCRIRGCGIAAEALQTGHPCLVRDAEQDERIGCCRGVVSEAGIRSCAAFPFRLHGEVCGVFGIYSTEPRSFNPDEVSLLEKVATDISYALEHLDREALRQAAADDLLRQSAITEAINRVLQGSLQSSTDVEVATLGLSVAQELTGSSFGWIGEVNSSGRLDAVARGDPGDDGGLGPGTRTAIVKGMEITGVVARVLNEGRSLIANQPAALPEGVGLPGGHPDLTAFLGVPLKQDGRAVGVVALGNKPSGYALRDQEAVEALSVALVEAIQRKRAEAALRASEDEYRGLFESSRDAIMTLEPPSWRLTSGNPATVRMFGAGAEEDLASYGPWDLSPDRQPDGCASAEKAREMIATALHEGSHVFEWMHRRLGGEVFPADVLLTRVERGGKAVLQATIRDITERKQAEEERQALDAELRQAQKMESVGRLAGGVAHDFNNALGVILGHAEMALKRTGPADRLRHDLETISQAALRSADLTRQLLAFARRQTIAPQVLDLNDAGAGMLKMLRRLIGEDIQLVWMPAAALWPVMMDPAQIDQLLANLLVNARDAIGGVGRVTVETRNVTLDEAHCASRPGCVPGEYVMLAVSDDGCGMERHVLDHVFEPFFTTKPMGQGTGLGLATVYGIVKQNSGYIDVSSQPGKGTTFRLYLPRVAGEVPDVQAAGAATEPRGRGETVLLVEDEPAMLEVGADTLAELGYSVLTARSPSEALRLAQAHAGEIHLLIADVVMPEMNGRDLAERLISIRPGLPCLFVSGYTADVIARRGVLDEGVRFLQKPFSRLSLAIKVREALE